MSKNSKQYDIKLYRNVIILVFILILVAILYHKFYVEEHFSDKKIKLILFYAKWCHYCEEYLKTNVFMDTSQQFLGNKDVVFLQLDYDKEKSLANKLNISSFPTIVSINNKDELIDKFVGNRFNQDDLIKFTEESIKRA